MGLDLLSAELGETNSSLVLEITNLQDQLRSQLISAPQIQIEANLASDSRALILRAIRRRGWIEITYHSAGNDEVGVRKVAPYELSQSGSHEYLQGYCANAKAIRNFRADRIVSVTEIADQEWPSETFQSAEKSISCQIQIDTWSRQVSEVMPQISQGSTSSAISGYSSAWLARSVISLAGQVEAVAPSEIRTEVAKRAKAALRNYQ